MRLILACLLSALVLAQTPTLPVAPQDYVCPMDPDVRSAKPGVCPRCGMNLVLGIPDPVEFPMVLKTLPVVPRAGKPVQLAFTVHLPVTFEKVNHFQIVHERLFHLFIVSQDLTYFVHDHPVLGDDSVFRYTAVLPKPGMYQVMGDFYPLNGTPQMNAKTLFVPGGKLSLKPPVLKPDLGTSHGANVDVELVTEPPKPIAGMKTLMFFRLTPGDGIEKYLGAWGHMLAASDDLIDLIHAHPFLADGGPRIQFNMIFPRARTYRVWVQFQRKGVVNTVAFNVPVSELK